MLWRMEEEEEEDGPAWTQQLPWSNDPKIPG